MHTPTWRPWSEMTDWGKGDALRFLRLLVAKSDCSLPVLRFFQAGAPHPYHDEQWVHCTDHQTIRSMDGTLQISNAWERADPPVSGTYQGPLRILRFADGSGLALRTHPKTRGVYALPTLPFVGDPTGVEPDLLWQPCLNPYGGVPSEELLPHERLLPTLGKTSARKIPLETLAEFASLLRELFADMPSPIELFGATGKAGPHYHQPYPERQGHLVPVFDGMARLARLHMPGRIGLQQGWNRNASRHEDPRIPTFLTRHCTFGGVYASAHQKMALLDALARSTPNADSFA